MASDAWVDPANPANPAEHADRPDTPGMTEDAAAAADEHDQSPGSTSLAAFGPPAPGWLRLVRGCVGIALLVSAWGALLGAVVLGLDVAGFAAHQRLLPRIGLYVAGAVGVFWLGVVGIVAVIVGAFCLTLALRNRSW